ncbi:MAG: prepilin-type N-terminal cleavage/methylation domain-containing protein [Synechococcaceae bacterium WB6_3B_236]|nr:prepilin-type N-terminal cleavage/methylation domain-containing protein [Synechococcaceae bacterium WB6_3B_236]
MYWQGVVPVVTIEVNKIQNYQPANQGFTLTEVLVTAIIVGILSAIALPNYFNSVQRTRQSDVVSQIAQIQTTIQAYADEFLAAPSSWDQLARLAPVMGNNGAVTGGNLSAFDSPNGGSYSISAVSSGLKPA